MWSFILDGEPSLKDRVLSFFKGAPKRYDFAPEMDPAAKKWLREYKKLFDQVANHNAGASVAENLNSKFGIRNSELVGSNTEKKIVKLGKITDASTGTAITKVIGKVVDDNALEPNNNTFGSNTNAEAHSDNGLRTKNGNKKTLTRTNNENMQVSGERFAFSNSKSGMANDSLLKYSGELRDLIEDRGDIIVDSYDKLVDIVNLAFDEPNTKATAYFGIIDVSTLQKIENSVPNIPKEMNGKLFKSGKQYSVAATLDSIRHLVDDKKLSRDDVVDYLDRLADTIVEFDSVTFDYYIKGQNKTAGITFKKHFKDGTIINFDLISKKQRSISLQTLYLESSDYQKKKAAKTLPMQNANGNTSKTQAGQPSTTNISQNFQNSNTSDKNSSKNVDSGVRSAINVDLEAEKTLAKTPEALDSLTKSQAISLIKRGVEGDDLLNAADLAEEIKSVGGEITKDGNAVLYHGTSKVNADKINSTGKMYGKEDGLFFSTKKDGLVLDYGEAVVKVQIPLEKLVLDDVFSDEVHLRMPTRQFKYTNVKIPSDNGERSALADGKKVTSTDVARVKGLISEAGIDPRGILGVSDHFFGRYDGTLTRTGLRFEFLEAAQLMLDDSESSFERAYNRIEAIADELVYNEKASGGFADDLKEIQRHIREITFEIRDQDKGEFDSLGGFNEFRKGHFGKLKIGNDGASVDSIYGELQTLYGLFLVKKSPTKLTVGDFSLY